jgi:hypothetical protein
MAMDWSKPAIVKFSWLLNGMLSPQSTPDLPGKDPESAAETNEECSSHR